MLKLEFIVQNENTKIIQFFLANKYEIFEY